LSGVNNETNFIKAPWLNSGELRFDTRYEYTKGLKKEAAPKTS
jgi:hypothetical protein